MTIFFYIIYDALLWLACIVAVLLAPLRLVLKLFPSNQRFSLWSGTPIINMAINAKAERLLNVNSKSLVYYTYYITDAFDYNFSDWQNNLLTKALLPPVVFIWSCLFADRLHFYCDRGLFPSKSFFTFDFRELYVYRILRIPVFLWTYGADVRSRQTTLGMGDPNCCTDCDNVGKYCLCKEDDRVLNMEKLSRLSTAIFSGMGDMFHYVPNSRDDLYYWPLDLQADGGTRYIPVYPTVDNEKPVRIVHAPNHRIFKGTNYLIQAIDNLQSEGLDVELILVEKVENQKALKIYQSADIIFDQCLMGNYGFFALEGMAMGKPVMCFVRKPNEYILNPAECPIINTHIDTLEQDIKDLVQHRGALKEIGMRGRFYIEKYFTLEAFSHRLENAYNDLGITV